MKRTISICCFIFLFLLAATGWSASHPVISVTGAVKQPLTLAVDDLSRFESVTVRLNEVTSDRNYHGSFYYRGVPLKTVLELAGIRKGDTDFIKNIDLAIVIRSAGGEQTVLSWGEVFYRNPAEIIIALSAVPVMPEKKCAHCHEPEVYERWYNPLQRQIIYPKLIVANDFFTDRSMEGITNIQVVELHPDIKTKKLPKLFSPRLTISGKVSESLHLKDLSSFPHKAVTTKQVGDGKGYHGLRDFDGVSLAGLLRRAGIEPDPNTVFLISAPDGYRSLLSYGELFLNRAGRDIIVADRVSGKAITVNGKFNLILPDDLAADRWIKAVKEIEVIRIKKQKTFRP